MAQLVALAALALVGAFAASPLATADGPIPTITTSATVPDVTVPNVTTVAGTTVSATIGGNPLTTTQATTQPNDTTQTTTQAASVGSNPTTSRAGASAGGNQTAIRLADGTISVSAPSLRRPTRLLIYRLTYSPRTLRSGHNAELYVSVQIRDSEQHVVRGVVVTVRRNGSSLRAVATTGLGGTAAVYLAVPRAVLRAGRSLAVLVRASAPAVSAQRTVRVPVKA